MYRFILFCCILSGCYSHNCCINDTKNNVKAIAKQVPKNAKQTKENIGIVASFFYQDTKASPQRIKKLGKVFYSEIRRQKQTTPVNVIHIAQFTSDSVTQYPPKFQNTASAIGKEISEQATITPQNIKNAIKYAVFEPDPRPFLQDLKEQVILQADTTTKHIKNLPPAFKEHLHSSIANTEKSAIVFFDIIVGEFYPNNFQLLLTILIGKIPDIEFFTSEVKRQIKATSHNINNAPKFIAKETIAGLKNFAKTAGVVYEAVKFENGVIGMKALYEFIKAQARQGVHELPYDIKFLVRLLCLCDTPNCLHIYESGFVQDYKSLNIPTSIDIKQNK